MKVVIFPSHVLNTEGTVIIYKELIYYVIFFLYNILLFLLKVAFYVFNQTILDAFAVKKLVLKLS